MGRPGRLGVRFGSKGSGGQLGLMNFNAEDLAKKLAIMLKVASASMNYMNQNDDYFKYISKRKDIDPNGFVDFIAHGNQYEIYINSHDIGLNHRAVAKLINKKVNIKKIKGIRLLSCNTGALPDGIAQKLADKIHLPVIAPTKYAFSYSNGEHFVAGSKNNGASPDYSDIGEYKIFYPRRTK